MKRVVAGCFLAMFILTAVLLGCQSMYANSGGLPTPTPAGSVDPGGAPDGFFVDGSNDVSGGGPPPPPVDDVADGEATQSNFRAIQVDALFEDTAGPKFVTVADMNGDGLLDVVSGHNQSQAVQLHLQQPAGSNGLPTFRTVTLAGTLPVSVLAGVQVADMDQDGAPDIVVLVKHTGITAFCFDGEPNEEAFTGLIMVLFSPGPNGDITDGDQWAQVRLQDSHPSFNRRWGKAVDEGRAIDFPETGGYTDLAVADIDLDGFPDIIASSNTEERECGMQLNTVEVWLNPGNGASPRTPGISRVRDGSHLDKAADGPATLSVRDDLDFWYPIYVNGNYPITLEGLNGNLDPLLADGAVIDPVTSSVIIVDVAETRGVEVYDVDEDGDLDIVSIWSNTTTQNVRWCRNPLLEEGVDALVQGMYVDTDGLTADTNGVPTTFDESIGLLSTSWERRPIGTVDGTVGDLALGDLDADGYTDVLVRDSARNVAMWFRRPTETSPVDPDFPPDRPDVADGDNTPVTDRFNFPWSVFVVDFYAQFRPTAIAAGPLTRGTANDVAVSVGGALYWYNNPVDDPVTGDEIVPPSPYGTWARDFVLDDSKLNGTTDDPTDLDYVGDGTLINDLFIVDLDGDGLNDIIATFDRRVDGGLHDDSIIWFRNTLGEE